MFYLAAQANMCYLILDNQTHALRMGVLEDTFHLEDFTHESRKERRRFAQTLVNMSIAMDGVALSIPPRDAVGRWNHVLGAE